MIEQEFSVHSIQYYIIQLYYLLKSFKAPCILLWVILNNKENCKTYFYMVRIWCLQVTTKYRQFCCKCHQNSWKQISSSAPDVSIFRQVTTISDFLGDRTCWNTISLFWKCINSNVDLLYWIFSISRHLLHPERNL